MNFYNDLVSWMTAEAIHDLQSRRYLISGLSNEVGVWGAVEPKTNVRLS